MISRLPSNTCYLRMLAIALVAWLVIPLANGTTGTWTKIANSPPSGVSLMLLLSDGTIMAQGGGGSSWYRLTPDNLGSYVHGTWTTLASMHDTRLYYASQVLKDGRVFVAGAEYGTGSKTSEIYDPVTNTWTLTPSSGQDFVDAISEILPDGRVIAAPVYGPSPTVIYDPVANAWATGPATIHGQNEVPWLKLPDDSILCVNGYNSSERYIPALNQWIADENSGLPFYSGGETGCGHLLANGKAFFRGYTHTGIYTPSGSTALGTWADGPDIPGGLNCGDTPGAVMVNGNVLFVAGPGYLTGPTSFFEYDPTANAFTQINGPTGLTYSNVPYAMKMLAMPDGSVLVNVGSVLYEYVPNGAALAAAQPTITSVTHQADGSYHLVGTQLNGINEGAAYGDDNQMSTNYPLVRLTDGSGKVYYARTYNWSSTGVMTGSTPVSTEFKLPLNLPAGTYSLVAVANGVASDPVSLTTPDTVGDAAPTVAIAANAAPGAITGTTTALSVLGADADGGGESNLTYTWSLTSAPTGASTPTLSINGSNAAKNTTATFRRLGSYTFAATITDSSGLSVSSSVTVSVTSSLSGVTVTPSIASISAGQQQQLKASGVDQFGNTLTAQPSVTWSILTGGGTISASGLYTAPASGALAIVTATASSYQGSATLYVVSSPWVSADINSPAIAGFAYDNGGTFTVSGEGSDIWGTSDQFHYVYRSMSGDGAIIARVVAQQNTAGWAKAGVMIRESTSAGAAHAMMVMTPSNGSAFQWRATSAGTSDNVNTGGRAAPYWVKLVRSGNTITGYSSSNGTNWDLQGSASFSMTSSVLVGLAVDSANTSTPSGVTFDNVVVLAATNDAITVNPGSATAVNVLANDSGTSLSVSSFTQGSKGTVSNSGGGNLLYTANLNATGNDSFTYMATDASGATANATVNVVINGLRAYYRLDEGTGTICADATGNGYDGAMMGATWSTGINGSGGAAFTGTGSSYMSIPALNLNTNTVTITAWVKRNGAQSAWTGIAFCRDGTTVSGLHFGTANELRYTWANAVSTYNWNSGLVVPDGQWTFVALVVTPSNATVYMQPEGGLLSSAVNAVSNAASAFDGITAIGQDPNGSARYFNGQMDELRFYNIALNSSSITALSATPPTVGTPASLTGIPGSSLNHSLSVLGASISYPESSLTYIWTTTNAPSGAANPVFSANGSNVAKNAIVTTYQSGAYTFLVTIADPTGGSVTSSVAATVNLTPMDTWRALKFASNASNPVVAGDSADNDNDGLSNLMEYALNTDPQSAQQSAQPTFSFEGANVAITYRQNVAATDVTYTVEQSEDLVHWTPATPTNSTLSNDGATRVIKASVPTLAVNRLLLRLTVTSP